MIFFQQKISWRRRFCSFVSMDIIKWKFIWNACDLYTANNNITLSIGIIRILQLRSHKSDFKSACFSEKIVSDLPHDKSICDLLYPRWQNSISATKPSFASFMNLLNFMDFAVLIERCHVKKQCFWSELTTKIVK